LIPALVQALTTHAKLSQNSADAAAAYEVYPYLLHCRTGFFSLSSFVQAGNLPDAARACEGLERQLKDVPVALDGANVMASFKVQDLTQVMSYHSVHWFTAQFPNHKGQCRGAAQRRVLEKYCLDVERTHSSFFNPRFELVFMIHYSPYQPDDINAVRDSETILSLSDILSSLSASSISSQLMTLRRDLTTYFFERLSTQPTSISISASTQIPNVEEFMLTLFPSPPNTELRIARLQNFSIMLQFLNDHLFPFLPDSQIETFPRSLCKPITTGILNYLLIPSLPSSFVLLPAFLDLVQKAVEFEDASIVEMLGNPAGDKVIKAWADSVGGHYERRRRLDILENIRTVMTHAEHDPPTFRAEIEKEVERSAANSTQTEGSSMDHQSWGLNEMEEAMSLATDWSFDDDIDTQEEPTPQSQGTHDPLADEDPAAAWGWNDDNVSPTSDNFEETAWDDPWGEEPQTVSLPSTASATNHPQMLNTVKKPASKDTKAQLNNGSLDFTPIGAGSKLPASAAPTKQVEKAAVIGESFTVSSRISHIAKIVEGALKEAKEFASSRIVIPPTLSPGSIIFQAAVSALDLFRALCIVKFDAASPSSMQFSNDCMYLSSEIARILRMEPNIGEVAEKLTECKRSLEILGDSWFDETIVIILHPGPSHLCSLLL
jgi:centromere/kinetochore protein ZW10